MISREQMFVSHFLYPPLSEIVLVVTVHSVYAKHCANTQSLQYKMNVIFCVVFIFALFLFSHKLLFCGKVKNSANEL